MFIKKTKVKSGKNTYTYLQLAESVWRDGRPTHRIVANLGRTDRIDPHQVDRIICALAPYGKKELLDPEALKVLGAKEYGPLYLLEHLWRLLGLDKVISTYARERSFEFDPGQAIKAMVFSRLMEPGSERGCSALSKRCTPPNSMG